MSLKLSRGTFEFHKTKQKKILACIILHTQNFKTFLVMPQLDIGTHFQILSEESQALRNLDVHFFTHSFIN